MIPEYLDDILLPSGGYYSAWKCVTILKSMTEYNRPYTLSYIQKIEKVLLYSSLNNFR